MIVTTTLSNGRVLAAKAAGARAARCRPEHLAGIARLRTAGHFLFGGAMLDGQGGMVGSAGVFEFADRAELDVQFNYDPYLTGGVGTGLTCTRGADRVIGRDRWCLTAPFAERTLS